MKHTITALALSLFAAGIFAADAAASKPLTAQQQKACLSGTAAPASAPMTQQQKMAACAKQNKGKKGDDYKAAQKACLAA